VSESAPVPLRDVGELSAQAEAIVAALGERLAELLPAAEVHHIGATALPAGTTKGDVDANVRVPAADFDAAVAALRIHFEVAQPESWSAGFASFSTGAYALPLGIQLTAIGSPSDFLLELRDRMRSDPGLLRRYDEVKRDAAPGGAVAYWEAKDRFLRELRSG
jgi:GrpB-like predicted nucleotidyltransferase (UPF0157 family)